VTHKSDNHNAATAPTAIKPTQDELNLQESIVEETMLECWTRPTGLFLFSDEACHLSWKYTLEHGAISAVESVEPLSEEQASAFRPDSTGAIRVAMRSGFEGVFRSCAFPQANHTYWNELLAYHVDRLLHIHRTPPVVFRQVDANEMSALLVTDTPEWRHLQQVRMHCHLNAAKMSGVIVGWTRYSLRPITTAVLSSWFASEAFDVRSPTQRLLEFSKLAIALLIFDLPERLVNGPVQEMFVPRVVNGKADKITGNYFYVLVENERASWDIPYSEEVPATPVCNRERRSSSFRCQITWPTPSRKIREQLRGILTSFLESACLFPKAIAERMLMYGSLDPATVVSLTHEVHRAMRDELGDRFATTVLPSMKALDGRLRRVFNTLVSCAKRFDIGTVLVPEAIDSIVPKTPRVHIDPIGRRFVYNDKTGRWMRDTTTTVSVDDINRDKLYATARQEILKSGRLGLLRPSEDELNKLRNTTQSGSSLHDVVLFAATADAPITPSAIDDYKLLFG
jgi:hypothetical protein